MGRRDLPDLARWRAYIDKKQAPARCVARHARQLVIALTLEKNPALPRERTSAPILIVLDVANGTDRPTKD